MYPESLRIGCDSAFYNDLDPQGRDVYTVHPGTPPPPPGKLWKYDDDAPPGGFASVDQFSICSGNDYEYPAYTNGFPGLPIDRTIFCPAFWTLSLTTLSDAGNSIQADTSDLGMFARLGARL